MAQRCRNLHHRIAYPPVRYCPTCGAVVNRELAKKECTRESHARVMVPVVRFCVHCGQEACGATARDSAPDTH
jgi:hypothetical protein